MPQDTDAALKTDVSVATDKNTTATLDSSIASKPGGGRSDDDKSIEAGELESEVANLPEISDYAPPLRIIPGRLAGSFSTLQVPIETHQKARRRKSDSAVIPRSGSRSPGFDGGSSISSPEDAGVDNDILTDKMGTLELDLEKTQQASQGLNRSLSNLPPVTERMSEETLDDVHAFQDVKREGSVSRGNSITTGGEVSSNVLEPLDEVDDEDSNEGGGVKITNMEDILEVAEEEILEGSPSLPTC